MKKLLLALLLALCTVLALGFAACDSGTTSDGTTSDNGGTTGNEGSGGTTETTSYNVTVTCGTGGSYTLSHQNPIAENTEVTLTVTPESGYVVSSVKVNGSTVSLTENKYTFPVTGDTAISLTFKTAKYSVTVDCGTNGTYSISHIGTVNAGTEITLTVTPYSGYLVDTVTVNGTAKELTDNVLTFTLSDDAAIVITFKAEAYNVNVTCGEHGSYTLSHQNPVAPNTKVTLTVTPETDYTVDKVLVDGVEKSLTEGACTFTVTKDTAVTITFKLLPGIFPEEYLGVWDPNVGAGTAGSTLEIHGGSVIFNDVARTVTVSGKNYSFKVVDDEGTTFNYSFTFQEIFGGKDLLVMTYRDPKATETTTLYYLKDGVDYFTYEAVKDSRWEEAVGFWSGSIPLEINRSYIMVEGSRAIVMEESETYPNTPKTLLVSNTVYTVSFTIDTAMTNRIMSITLESSEGRITCTRVADPTPVLVPQHKGTYTSEDKTLTIVVDEDGKFYFGGTLCELRSGDASGSMETYTFTCNDVGYAVDFLKKNSKTTNYVWLRQSAIVQDEGVFLYGENYPFKMSYTVSLNADEHGSATLTASAEPNDAGYYASGTTLTFTVKADPGYVINFCYFNSRSGTGEDHTYEAQGKSEFVLEYTLSNNFYDWYGSTSIRFYVTFKESPAATPAEGAKELPASAQGEQLPADVKQTADKRTLCG